MKLPEALLAPTFNREPRPTGRLKAFASDFIVEEILGIEPDNEGEHLLLKVRKCQLNTDDVARELKRLYQVADVDVSFSGLKDKQAITEQWFCVRTPQDASTLPVAADSLSDQAGGTWGVVISHRHLRKLRRGAHRRNRFTVRLTELQSSDNFSEPAVERVARQCATIVETGFPNYFGVQRFGKGGDNLRRALQHFQNPRRKITRTQKGFCLSAARSALFNQVCLHRLSDGSFNKPQLGEPMMLQGSNSYFVNDDEVDVTQRFNKLDIHTSGPMWGRGQPLGAEPYSAYESNLLEPWSEFMRGLENAGLKQERRALRAIAHGLSCTIESNDTVLLSFELDKSVYATTLVNELANVSQS